MGWGWVVGDATAYKAAPCNSSASRRFAAKAARSGRFAKPASPPLEKGLLATMTVAQLSAWIAAALALQVGVFLILAFYRHWRSFEDLRAQLMGTQPAAPPAPPAPAAQREELAWTGWRDLRVARRQIEDPNGNVCSFYLQAADGAALPPYKPGQFLTFRLAIPDPATGADKTVVRCYSLSDAPRADQYRISVKRVPPSAPALPPGLSSNFLHERVQQGAVLAVKAPSGHFYLDPAGTDPVVLIGGGIGVTPMLAMLHACLETGSAREIWFFYAVREAADLVFKDALRTLAARHPNLHLHICASRPRPSEERGRDYDHPGHLDIDRLRLTLPLAPFHYYICGPGPMMETLVPALAAWGVPDERIHYEAFGPASVPKRAPAVPAAVAATQSCTVRFEKSGKSIVWDGRDASLLDFAERHGVALDSGCRAGSCGSCQTRVLAGAVAYRSSPDFDPDPGHCLPCVAVPKSEQLTLAA